MSCDNGIDPVFYRAWMKSQRAKERDPDYTTNRQMEFQGKSIDQIGDYLRAEGEIPSPTTSPESSVAITPAKAVPSVDDTPQIETGEVAAGKKRRLFTEVGTRENDQMPPEFQHVRDSERKVKDDLYMTCANLSGEGFSLQECISAVVTVANGMFGRKWKKPGDSTDGFDVDTLPDKKRILEKLRQVEAQSLCLVVREIELGKAEGHMITHASDSTTRRGVGQFIGQGIHIGQDSAFPLPLLGIAGETREDIGAQLGMGLEILSVVSGKDVKELASQVDTLLTDSVDHNKQVNTVVQELFDLEKPAGQIFCGTHTTLGFSNAMNKVVMTIELRMKLDTLLSTFMCSMELDSKNGSLSGQALDMMLKLFAPEYKHKSWNYFGLFTHYLEQRNVPLTLFAYKDHRFGCLSRASAVLLYNYEHINGFLSSNPHISNKLACLVRELQNLPHLKVIYAVFALLGVHLIEPFYSKTITKGVTHTELKIFYQQLHKGLSEKKADISIITLSSPFFPGISDRLFNGVKQSYGQEVLKVVMETAHENEKDVIMLINLMLPELATTLARQRRDYGLDMENFPAQFPIDDQANNIDDTPTNNMDMERLMGKTDYRLQKLQGLQAASRSIVLQKTAALRDASASSSFRSFRKQVEAKRELEVQWNKKVAKKFKDDAEKKQEAAVGQERKRLLMMENLKVEGGPFTNAEEVEEFLRSDIAAKLKQKRMKREIQFARDSSTTLPKVDPLFKIQVTQPNKKRRDKSAAEFGDALMAYLGRKADRSVMEYETFQQCLRELLM